MLNREALRERCLRRKVQRRGSARFLRRYFGLRGRRGSSRGRRCGAGVPRPCRAEALAAAVRDRGDAARTTRREYALRRANDADIARASAEVAAERDANVALARHLHAQHDVPRADQHARCAITALQRVLALECVAQLPGDLVAFETFDRSHLRASACYGERDAGARWNAVDQERACAADAVLAPDMGSSEIVRLPQEIGEAHARLDLCAERMVVDDDRDRHHWLSAR